MLRCGVGDAGVMETLTEPAGAALESEQEKGVQLRITLAALSVAKDQLIVLVRPPASPGGAWTLPSNTPPGGVPLDEAARSIMAAAARKSGTYVEQLYTWAEDGAQGMLEVGYLGLTENLSRSPAGCESGPGMQWLALSRLPALDPAHARILDYARQRVRSKLGYTNLAWSLLPAEFTLSDLQHVYEIVQERPLDKRNFRKWVLANNLVEPTPRERRDGAHRPARLYRFVTREMRVIE